MQKRPILRVASKRLFKLTLAFFIVLVSLKIQNVVLKPY
jgi:hypothetical protein